MQITRSQADAILNVLEEKAGYNPRDNDDREHMVGLIASGKHRELRICYGFGFGGKLWMSGERVYTSTYRETETAEIHECIMDVNHELAKIMNTEPVVWEKATS